MPEQHDVQLHEKVASIVSAQTIIEKAISQIGTKEHPFGSNKVIYNTDYYGGTVSGSDFPWCCVFVWWIFKQCGASDLFYNGAKTAYCPAVETYYKNINQWFTKGQPGDIVLYDFYGKGYACHIGIVEKVNSDGTYSVIEGNTSLTNDDNGGSVMRRVRKNGIRGFARPAYCNTISTKKEANTVNITLPILRKGSNGAIVQSLQMLLIAKDFACGDCGADGDFGAATDSAVRDFQNACNIEVDGVVGANTWEHILKNGLFVKPKKATYRVEGITHIVELSPLDLKHVETHKATYSTPYANFVNSLFFSGDIGQGMAASAGKIIANYPTHGKPVATLIVHTDGSVEFAYVEDLTTVKNLFFAVSGYGIYPTITAAKEGFTGIFSDVTRSTNRPIIGYRKSDNKIIIAVRSNSSSTRANETAKNLKLDFAISLDGGGSTTLKVDGKYHFKGDGRRIWGGITW